MNSPANSPTPPTGRTVAPAPRLWDRQGAVVNPAFAGVRNQPLRVKFGSLLFLGERLVHFSCMTARQHIPTGSVALRLPTTSQSEPWCSGPPTFGAASVTASVAGELPQNHEGFGFSRCLQNHKLWRESFQLLIHETGDLTSCLHPEGAIKNQLAAYLG